MSRGFSSIDAFHLVLDEGLSPDILRSMSTPGSSQREYCRRFVILAVAGW